MGPAGPHVDGTNTGTLGAALLLPPPVLILSERSMPPSPNLDLFPSEWELLQTLTRIVLSRVKGTSRSTTNVVFVSEERKRT